MRTQLTRPHSRPAQRAFHRLDLLVIVALVALLLGWVGFCLTGERGRTASCARNLATLGQAMHNFANEHAQALPPAAVEPAQLSWDEEILPYFHPGQAPDSAEAKRALRRTATPRFLCPSDRLARGQPRSYAMSRHDMSLENWPAGPDNLTGVGLNWTKSAVATLLTDEAVEAARKDPATLALVKLSWMPAPADTLLLTEYVHAENVLGSPKRTTVANPAEQTEALKGDLPRFHGGRFNYLMVDGHVERLTPYQTGNCGTDVRIWTIGER